MYAFKNTKCFIYLSNFMNVHMNTERLYHDLMICIHIISCDFHLVIFIMRCKI
jgi:hypothetical protein